MDTPPDTSSISLPHLAIISTGAVVTIAIVLKVFQSGFKRSVHTSFSNVLVGVTSILSNKDSVLKRDGVDDSIKGYENLFSGARSDIGSITNDNSIETRKKEYKSMVNSFYDLVTDFYEWGWGQSFHFAPRIKGETFYESILRSEHYVALRLGLKETDKVIDVGCGVGGPMRNIQQFSGADITGVTINEYQVRVGNQYCKQKGIDNKSRLVQGDFQKLPEKFEAGSFDAAFAFEATCHSPDRVACFSGVNHCLKKGGLFAAYEWIVLPEKGYDAKNENHVRVKEGIEVGNGLPTLATSEQILENLRDAGFEVLDSFDANRGVHSPYEIPWYQTLKGGFSLKGFRMTNVGRLCTHTLVSVLEFLRIAPKGSVRVSALLNATALDLVEGGEKELFTPSFFFVARKK